LLRNRLEREHLILCHRDVYHIRLQDQLAESREVAQTNVEATFKTHVAGGIDNRYKPLVPLVPLVPLPEADSAAPALLVGFTEMFLPAVLS
jgi:hypothetical protein